MYEKTIWKPRKGTGLNRFTETERAENTVVLTNTPDSISEPGTPFSAENMNKIEQGIEDAHSRIEQVKEEADAAANAKQDKITATGENNLLTAPASAGGQPGIMPKSNFIPMSQKGAADGIATLDENGVIPAEQLPDGGQGLLAVSTDNTLSGNGTSADPLGLADVSLTVSSNSDNPAATTSAVKTILQSIWNKLSWVMPNLKTLLNAPKSLVGTVMYMTDNAFEQSLGIQYGGTWIRGQENIGKLTKNLGYQYLDCNRWGELSIPVTAGVLNTIHVMPTLEITGTYKLYKNNYLVQTLTTVKCAAVFNPIIPAPGDSITVMFDNVPYGVLGIYKAMDVNVYGYVRVL